MEYEMRKRLWFALLDKYLKLSALGRPNWTATLKGLGCEVLPYYEPQEDTSEHIYVRDVAMGNIQVPREVAIKILALGFIP